jgi:hypothetical protein
MSVNIFLVDQIRMIVVLQHVQHSSCNGNMKKTHHLTCDGWTPVDYVPKKRCIFLVESENGQAGHHDALMNLSRMFATVATNPSRVTTVAFC